MLDTIPFKFFLLIEVDLDNDDWIYSMRKTLNWVILISLPFFRSSNWQWYPVWNCKNKLWEKITQQGGKLKWALLINATVYQYNLRICKNL